MKPKRKSNKRRQAEKIHRSMGIDAALILKADNPTLYRQLAGLGYYWNAYTKAWENIEATLLSLDTGDVFTPERTIQAKVYLHRLDKGGIIRRLKSGDWKRNTKRIELTGKYALFNYGRGTT